LVVGGLLVATFEKISSGKEEMRTSILISALVLLLAANFLMMYVRPFGMMNTEGFKVKDASGRQLSRNMKLKQGFKAKDASGNNFQDLKKKEGFSTYTLANGGGAGDSYQVIGAFDGIRLKTGNPSSWRYTSPN
jgi:hypothetical protein